MQKRWINYSSLNMKTIKIFSDIYGSRGVTQAQKWRDPHCTLLPLVEPAVKDISDF